MHCKRRWRRAKWKLEKLDITSSVSSELAGLYGKMNKRLLDIIETPKEEVNVVFIYREPPDVVVEETQICRQTLSRRHFPVSI
jgi:hypothetical protein